MKHPIADWMGSEMNVLNTKVTSKKPIEENA